MSCSHCQGGEAVFDDGQAQEWLRDYRREGPSGTTRTMLAKLRELDLSGLSLLDIGGGIGVIPFELLQDGLENATLVEASSAAVERARETAQERGVADRMQVIHGDFVEMAGDLPPADVVTLDRVICCYPDMTRMVGYSSAQAGRALAAVYPRDAWWVRLGVWVANLWLVLRRNPFRGYVHSTEAIDAVIRGNGFTRTHWEQTAIWEIAVYRRQGRSAAPETGGGS